MRYRWIIGLVLMSALLCNASPASAREGPREIVTGYMNALKAKDYPKILSYLGFDLPADWVSPIASIMNQGNYFIWAVRDYKITSVKRHGDLAEVVVEETLFKDINAEGRSSLEANAPILAEGIQWGDSTVTERFVLVHLDGRWQFDYSHSGVQVQDLTRRLIDSFRSGTGPDAKKAALEAIEHDLVKFINGIGYGQLLQSFGTLAGVAPMLAAIAVPNFVRARAQGQVTACKSNLKNIGTAMEMYSTDNSGRYATSLSQLTPNYLKVIPTCPSAGRDTYSAHMASASNPDEYTIVCFGNHHGEVGDSPNYPQYTSTQGLIEH